MKNDERLEEIYRLHDRYTAGHGAVCRQGCSACCTCNVTMTSLEASYLLQDMGALKCREVALRAIAQVEKRRFQPALTINGIAARCLDGKSIPDEENDPNWGPCFLLENGACPLYEKRPLGCRMLLSRVSCHDAGYADMPDIVMTMNNLFMQVVEHLDAGGRSGNFADMILWEIHGRENLHDDLQESFDCLVPNQRAPVFMVPPSHRARVAPLMEELSRVMAADFCIS